MHIFYRTELEKAARRMILIHRTDTLIKLIIRTITRDLKVLHAGIFLFDKQKQNYVLTASRGKQGVKVPPGLVKISNDSPLIKYFFSRTYNLWKDNFLLAKRTRIVLKRDSVKKNTKLKNFFERLLYQVSIYKIDIALPIAFRGELLGIFILGEKRNKNNFYPEELTFLSILSSDVAMAIRNATLFDDLRVQLEKNQTLFFQTISAFAHVIEAKDKYTLGHTERVAEYSLNIAIQIKKIIRIKNWEEFKKNLKIAALLHDIGKIGIPEKVLNKRKPLNDNDWTFIRAHPLIGENILSPLKDLKEVILAVKYHHERYDGKGYPYGLEGKRIPLMAAIIFVADAYDSMISDRPYRKALSRTEAKKEIEKNSGLQFNPKVVTAFIQAYTARSV